MNDALFEAILLSFRNGPPSLPHAVVTTAKFGRATDLPDDAPRQAWDASQDPGAMLTYVFAARGEAVAKRLAEHLACEFPFSYTIEETPDPFVRRVVFDEAHAGLAHAMCDWLRQYGPTPLPLRMTKARLRDEAGLAAEAKEKAEQATKTAAGQAVAAVPPHMWFSGGSKGS